MHPYSVIEKPILSEKSNDLREREGKYSFVVKRDATKDDVKKAVSMIWGVEVLDVHTMIQRGKVKRRGMNMSKTSNFKKAIVKLAEGAKLPLFDEQ
jgi:large subunit ribosomal protein L23